MENNYQGITGSKSKYISVIVFILGLIGAVGFRAVLMVNSVNELWAIVIWYTATVFYIIFYLYRYYIENERRKILAKNNLRQKLISGSDLSENDRLLIKKIIDSIMVSKWCWNLVILIILSLVFLIIQIIFDFL